MIFFQVPRVHQEHQYHACRAQDLVPAPALVVIGSYVANVHQAYRVTDRLQGPE